MNSLYQSSIKSLPLLGHGKVRDNYAVGDDKILIVTSDRLSAFDVVMNEPIPGKGKVLNQMTDFWFSKLGHIVPNHLTGVAPESVVAADEVEQVQGRAVVAKRLKPIMVEAVVRGYIIGSGWKDYQDTGSICGIKLPEGLQQAEKLPQPIFTPAAKADLGEQRAAAGDRLLARLFLHIERALDDVLERGAMRKQIEALEHHRDLGADRDDRAVIAVDTRALDADLAAIVALEPVDAAQDGRLAGA